MNQSSAPSPAWDALRPDYQRFLSPVRRFPIVIAVVVAVILAGCIQLAGVVTGDTTYTAVVAVAPRVEPASLELSAVLPSSGISSAGSATSGVEVSSIIAFFDREELADEVGLASDVTFRVSADGDARMQLAVSGGAEATVSDAVEQLTAAYLADVAADLQRDLRATESGVRTQLTIIEDRVASLGTLPNDQTVRGSLAFQRASLNATLTVLGLYPPDAVGVEVTLVEAPTFVSSSRVARVALGIVLASMIIVALAAALFVFDDRVLSGRDLRRASLGAELVGVVGTDDPTGVAALASGLGRRFPQGITTIRLYPTAQPVADLAQALSLEFGGDGETPAVEVIDTDERASAIRRVAVGTIDVVVVDWGRSQRRQVTQLISLLRFAGADQPVVLIRSVPAGELAAIL